VHIECIGNVIKHRREPVGVAILALPVQHGSGMHEWSVEQRVLGMLEHDCRGSIWSSQHCTQTILPLASRLPHQSTTSALALSRSAARHAEPLPWLSTNPLADDLGRRQRVPSGGGGSLFVGQRYREFAFGFAIRGPTAVIDLELASLEFCHFGRDTVQQEAIV
jgi:hypothetical protein